MNSEVFNPDLQDIKMKNNRLEWAEAKRLRLIALIEQMPDLIKKEDIIKLIKREL